MSKEKKTKYIEGGQDKDRLLIVQKMIATGFSSRAIRKWIGEEYEVGQSQQYKVLKAARLDMAEHSRMEREELLAMNNARLEEILMRTFKNDDNKNALKAIDLINKTNGIYNAEESSNQGTQTIKIKFGE